MAKRYKTEEDKNREKFLREQVGEQRKRYPFRWLPHVVLPGFLMFLCLYGQTGVYNGCVQKGLRSFENGYFYLPSSRSFILRDDRALSPEEKERFCDKSVRNYALYLEEISNYRESYAISPYFLESFPVQDMELWGIDRNSYNNYAWSLRKGRGFSDDPAEEILVMAGKSQVGDKIHFYKDGKEIETTVVGILDISGVPGITENGTNGLKAIGHRPLGGNLNFVTRWPELFSFPLEKNRYLLHPGSVLNDTSKISELYGIFIKPGEAGEKLKEALKDTGTIYSFSDFPNSITMKAGNFWLAWLLLFGMVAGGTLAFLWHDNKAGLLKWAVHLKIYRICGMKEEEVRRLVLSVARPWNEAGMGAALIFFLFILRWHQIEPFTMLIGIVVFIAYEFLARSIIKSMVRQAICLEEKARPGRVCSAYPLAEEKTLLENIMLPQAYQGKTEEDLEKKAKWLTGLLMLYDVRQERCKNLSPREKILTKIARALMTQDCIEVDKNWDVLPKEEREKLEGLLQKLEASGNVRIVIQEDDFIMR